MHSLPRLLTVASEERSDASYRHEGRYRQSEEHCVFQYTLAGEGTFFDGVGEHRVPAGCGFLCKVRDPATAYGYPPGATTPWRFLYICFTGAAADTLVREMLSRLGPVLHLSRTSTAISRLMELRDGEPRRDVTPAAGAALVMDLLLELLSEAQRPDETTAAHLLVHRARQHIESNLRRNLQVADVATSLEVSREHLTRVFREMTGVSPYQYLLRRKMILAARLLKQPGATVGEVASELGYADPAHFSRAFKRSIAMSPRRFREVGIVPVS